MTKSALMITAIVLASTLAYGQDQRGVNEKIRSYDARYFDTARQRSDYESSKFGSQGRVIRNANDCAPDRAKPVWGADSALLGYACVTPNAN